MLLREDQERAARKIQKRRPFVRDSKLADLQIRVDTYSKLLRKLQFRTDGESQLAIAQALASNPDSLGHSVVENTYAPSPNTVDPEHDFVAGASSFDESSDPVVGSEYAFMGAASEVTVLRRVIKELGPDTDTPSAGISIAYTCNAYHLDDDVAPDSIDLHLPDKHLAQKLLSIYLDSVHFLFPILWREDIIQIYQNTYMPASASNRSETELAILNLVFAIGQCFADRFVLELVETSDSHRIYFRRAKFLMDISDNITFSAVSLQKVQLLGLSGMYLVACNQTNRAWNVVGVGLRMANAIGLHVQTGLPDSTPDQKERRSRTWYSLCYLESILCTMTGRPSVLSHRYSAVNVPRALPHENSNDPTIGSSTIDPYMAASASLSVIVGDIVGRLYPDRQDTTAAGWEELKRNIELLAVHLERWRKDLPEVLSFDKPLTDQNYMQKRFDLAIRFGHANLLLRRPCMVRSETLSGAIEAEPDLKDFISRSAMQCLQDSRGMVYLLTTNFIADGTTPVKLGPWWCILHYAVSAASILLLEMAQGGVHSSPATQHDVVFEAVVTLIIWIDNIAAQGRDNLGARKCGFELASLLSRVSAQIGRRFSPDFVMQHRRKHANTSLVTSVSPVPTVFSNEAGDAAFLYELGSLGVARPAEREPEH